MRLTREQVEAMDGHTPGPWWSDEDDSGNMLADGEVVVDGTVTYAADEDLILRAPELRADWLEMYAEVERLRSEPRASADAMRRRIVGWLHRHAADLRDGGDIGHGVAVSYCAEQIRAGLDDAMPLLPSEADPALLAKANAALTEQVRTLSDDLAAARRERDEMRAERDRALTSASWWRGCWEREVSNPERQAYSKILRALGFTPRKQPDRVVEAITALIAERDALRSKVTDLETALAGWPAAAAEMVRAAGVVRD